MKVIFLGPPGAGKGTHAVRICERLAIPQISTGDILRAAIRNQTQVGLEAKSFIDKGQLVPDETIINIVAERLKQADCANGYLLDGFPRTIAQAEALEKIAKIDVVINLEVSDETLVNRLAGRRVCPSCGKTFHVNTLEGKSDCSTCGAALIQRQDDKPETVLNRLKVYHAQSAPLITYYQASGKVKPVDGSTSIEQGTRDVMAALGV